jgi:cell division protein FtsI/penicillin-binding protein 2
MRDVKHLTDRERRFRALLFLQRKKQPLNRYRGLAEERPKRRRLRVILPILAVLLALYPLINLLLSTKNALSSVAKAPDPAPKARPLGGSLDSWQSFRIAAEALPLCRPTGDHLTAPLPDGGMVSYSFDPELQERIGTYLKESQVPYGVFIAFDPQTGRILAMTSHSSLEPGWAQNAFYTPFPMASLFKIITAAAALEMKRVTPETVLSFNGRLTSENPRYWCAPTRRRGQEMSLDVAMGKSVNPVFGKLASEHVGREALLVYTDRFGFNQALFPGTPVTPSRIEAPRTEGELKLMGAGLGREVKISPLHAAALIAAVANGGVMMTPVLADEITNAKGERVTTPPPAPLRRLVNEETAGQLSRMLATTVSSGTSRKVFHDRRGRLLLASVSIAAKTGSISGTDPEGHYSWFTAYAPIEKPRIALAALIINRNKWKIKATHVGEKALETYFK